MISIKGDVARHLYNLRADLNYNSIPVKTRKMIKTYCLTGVIRTGGLASKLAIMHRREEGKQILISRSGYIRGYNIQDTSIYEAVHAAVTMNRISGSNDSPYYCVSNSPYGGGDYSRRKYSSTENLVVDKPVSFYIHYSGINEHLKINKLSDPLEVTTEGSLTVNIQSLTD